MNCRRHAWLVAFGLCAALADAGALDLTNTDGVVYREASVIATLPAGILIVYSDQGRKCGASIPFAKLSPELQRQFNRPPEPTRKIQGELAPQPTEPARPRPAESAPSNRPNAVVAPPPAPGITPVREPKYKSQQPLYFRLVFGEDNQTSMLGAVDEAKGSGSGYDTVYLDENLNNDLGDEPPKLFPKYPTPIKDTTGLDPQFNFKGPLGQNASVHYSVTLHGLQFNKSRNSGNGREITLMWNLSLKDWSYRFINGSLRLYPSAAAALQETPARLGGTCAWEINSRVQKGKAAVTAALKDANGCRLRSVHGGQTLKPTLTLSKDGAVVQKDKMEFG